MTGPTVGSGRRRRWWPPLAAALVVVIAVGVYLAARPTHAGKAAARTPDAAAGAAAPLASNEPLAPNGMFTTIDGKTMTIASLRGKPAMMWFVAGGCASCAASIPAVAAHLRQLTAGGLRVVTLGMYGAFAPGKQGLTQLAEFGRAAAGGPITRPSWLWGMASKSLSMAYDPGGAPDSYVLINPAGRIVYKNTVPVSTMSDLLAAAGSVTGHRVAARQPQGNTSPTAVTLP